MQFAKNNLTRLKIQRNQKEPLKFSIFLHLDVIKCLILVEVSYICTVPYSLWIVITIHFQFHTKIICINNVCALWYYQIVFKYHLHTYNLIEFVPFILRPIYTSIINWWAFYFMKMTHLKIRSLLKYAFCIWLMSF